MQSILGVPAALLEKKNSGAYENFGLACSAQLIPYQVGSSAVTDLPLEK